MTDIEVTKEEIDACKKEYFEKHTYYSTNDPVILSDITAIAVVKSRKLFSQYLNSVHESHNMTDWETKVLAPAGTERFYSYRCCKDCEYEQYYHAAGRFIDSQLKIECKG